MTTDKSPMMNLDGVGAKHWKDVPAKELVYPDLDVRALGAEEVFVVSGNFFDGKNTYPAGTFIHHPAGTSHIPQSPVRVFVFFPEG